MEPTVALLTRIVEACGLELRMSVTQPRLPARTGVLSTEDRLKENDRLAALHLLRAAPAAVTTRQPLDVERVFTTLARHEVRYVVVGGIAAILHGWPGATADVGVLGAFDPDNFACLGAALRELGATGEGWDGDAATIGSVTAWSLDTEAGPVDLLFVLEPWGTYDELRAGADEIAGFGVTIPIVSLDDLIALKQALGRPKDLRVAVELEEIRRQRNS